MAKRKRGGPNVKKVITCFGICPIIDLSFSKKYPMVLLVHNISDEEISKRDFEACLRTGMNFTELPLLRKGKYAAFGMPGGGLDEGRESTKESTIVEEVQGEIGLKILREPVHIFTDGKLIFTNTQTKEMMRQFFFRPGKMPSIPEKYKSNKKVEMIENPIHIFMVKVEWENSPLRRLLIKKKKEYNEEEIEEKGMFVGFDELTKEEIESLGILELNEIDGIGIFTLPFLEETYETIQKEKTPWGERFVYFSHLMWIQRGLKEYTERMSS